MTTTQPEPADGNNRKRRRMHTDDEPRKKAFGEKKNETVNLVRLLTGVGPDIPEISRRLERPRESVRHCYKEKILNKGFAVQAKVDHEKLGLRRVIAVLDFTEEYKNFSQSILESMNELCFLVGFAKTMPRGYYIVNFSVPREFVDDLKSFLKAMKEKGMFSHLDIAEFDWIRFAPMKPEFYDFDVGMWDFDWTAKTTSDFGSAHYMSSDPAKFDYVDLLLIKELQMDADKSLKEISDRLKVNYKKLARHYKEHVMARRLLSGYSVNWMGTTYDYGIEKALHRQHRNLGVTLIAREVSEYETMSLRQAFDRLPFLWSEAAGANYFCEFTIPVEFNFEWLQYLTEAISAVKERTEVYAVDQSNAETFTIPYSLFNQAQEKWEINLEGVIDKYNGVF
jgi:DNA-binding Lrp family transcriptional regulator